LAEWLGIFAASYRGYSKCNKLTLIGLPKVDDIGVANGVKGSGDGNLRKGAGAFEIEDTTTDSVGVL
jgi:hypothetical protein